MEMNRVEYGEYNNYTFSGVYPNASMFVGDVKGSGLPNRLKEESLTTIYYLLLANFANSEIASSDLNRFELKVAATIFQYGPVWEKGIEIQDKLRGLTEDELLTGSTKIYNHSMNPSSEPTTNTLEELPTINDQQTSKIKRSKLEAYSTLNTLLEKDATKEFIDKFKKLFKKVVQPSRYQTYITNLKEDRNEY